MVEPLELECCVVDLQRQEVRRGEECIGLTRKGVALLQYLQARPGVPVYRKELHREVWGYAEGVVSRGGLHGGPAAQKDRAAAQTTSPFVRLQTAGLFTAFVGETNGGRSCPRLLGEGGMARRSLTGVVEGLWRQAGISLRRRV